MSAPVPVLTIDGPSGAGKGTVAQRVAEALGWHLLDSGAVYRALALYLIEQGIEPAASSAVEKRDKDRPENDAETERAGIASADNRLLLAAGDFVPEYRPGEPGKPMRILVNGRVVGPELRTEAVGQMASRIAEIPEIREILLEAQRACRLAPGLVADGRDMGTVVFPEAEVKVFLTASAEERARRRVRQLKESGQSTTMQAVLDAMHERDRRDAGRVVAPLAPAADALHIDSSALSIDAVLVAVLDAVKAKVPLPSAGEHD